METSPLKSFATWARRELIAQVSARLTAVLAPSSPERVENQSALAMLERDIAAAGGNTKAKDAIADKVAYTWFNRIIALRFMDANGYTGIGVVSPAHGQQVGQPEILADAKRGSIDPAVIANKRTLDTITGLLDGTRPSADAQGEAYALLLTEYCRHWNRSMPFMFERESDYTELLIPSNLLAADSILTRAASALTEEVCCEVEVIGWLYQFYIAERKDEVFAGFKKNKKAGADEIPAATQLFTPHWIVRYLVENSLGRLWMLNHPESRLIDQMEYYIAPVDAETDFLKVRMPEALTVIDPACGSGHMLTYAFDLLYAIYEEQGYAPSEIPSLILTHNLYGTEIDPRAGALAAFALTMKARSRQRTFLNKGVEPNICVLGPVLFSPVELGYLLTKGGDAPAEEAFWNQFAEADTFGSLIQPDPALTVRLTDHLEGLDDGGDLFRTGVLLKAQRVIDQATYLSSDYSVVVANPPYMGSKQMNAVLSQFMKDEYPGNKSDLFAGFIERCTKLAGPRGTVAMITMQSWMFLSSYEKLRASLLTKQRITSMLHLGAHAFDSIGGEVVSSTAFTLANIPAGARSAAHKRAGAFIRLVDGTSEAAKVAALSTALEVQSKETGFHLASDDDFTAIPGSPIVYWLSEKMRAAFRESPALGRRSRSAKGLVTADNVSFVRFWWEVSQAATGFDNPHRKSAQASRRRWFPYAKGGEFRRWAGNLDSVVDWQNDGRRLQTTMTADGTRVRATNFNLDRIFSAGLAWTVVTSGEQSFRKVPRGCLFDAAAGMCQSDTDEIHLAVLNSRVVSMILSAINPTLNLHPGYLGAVPVPKNADELSTKAVSCLVENSECDWGEAEAAWRFQMNPLVALAQESLRLSIG